jgi:hypothetical protein
MKDIELFYADLTKLNQRHKIILYIFNQVKSETYNCFIQI